MSLNLSTELLRKGGNNPHAETFRRLRIEISRRPDPFVSNRDNHLLRIVSRQSDPIRTGSGGGIGMARGAGMKSRLCPRPGC